MKKNYFIGFLIVIIISVAGFLIWQNKATKILSDKSKNQNENKNLGKTDTSFKNSPDTILPKWKIYTNEKFGFSFQYPSTWQQQGKEVEVVNLSGIVTTIGVYFRDTLFEATLSIEYRLPPNGVKLYQYALSQYNSSQGWYRAGGKKIKIDGNDAVEASLVSKTDGRGKSLNPPVRSIIIDFLDKKLTGEIQVQFKTPLPTEDIEVAKFKQLLSTFRFIKN
jgi:hypothetical protein